MGVVYYANYLVWFEVGRTEYLLAQGMDYREVEKAGLFMAVVEARCVYKAPARYGETIIVETRPTDVKNSSLRFEYRVFKKDDHKLLCEGHTTHVLTDHQLKPKRIPEKIRVLLV
jgi:acyl-CoA thioester hydrolase